MEYHESDERCILKSENQIYSQDDDGLTIEIVWYNTPMRLKQDGSMVENVADESHVDAAKLEKAGNARCYERR